MKESERLISHKLIPVVYGGVAIKLSTRVFHDAIRVIIFEFAIVVVDYSAYIGQRSHL